MSFPKNPPNSVVDDENRYYGTTTGSQPVVGEDNQYRYYE